MQTEYAAKAETASPRFDVPDARTGKFLIFRLGNEEFGVPVLQAREILNFKQINSVADAPPNLKGVINLRGKTIPVVDIHSKLGLPAPDQTFSGLGASIVVVQANHGGDPFHIGIPFDRVIEVMDLETADIALRGARILLRVEDLLRPADMHSVASSAY